MTFPFIYKYEKTKKIPVKVNGGSLMFFFDQSINVLSLLKEDSVLELIVHDYALKNKDYDEILSKEIKIPLLPSNQELFVRIKIPGSTVWPATLFKEHKVLSKTEVNEIIYYNEQVKNKSSYLFYDEVCFIKIVIKDDLLLQYRGTKIPRLSECSVEIPILKNVAVSLNHAFSLLSEKYETHRRSHTGNVFKSVFCYDSQKNSYLDLDHFRHLKENELNNKVIADFKSAPNQGIKIK